MNDYDDYGQDPLYSHGHPMEASRGGVHMYKVVMMILGGVCTVLVALVGWIGNKTDNSINDLQHRMAVMEQRQVENTGELRRLSDKIGGVIYLYERRERQGR